MTAPDSVPTVREAGDEGIAAVLAAHAWNGDGWCTCGYAPRTMTDGFAHQAAALAPLIAGRERAAGERALTEALAGVTTHNGTPVTAKNLRWAATHEALSRSYIFDVLTGLADALAPETPEAGQS